MSRKYLLLGAPSAMALMLVFAGCGGGNGQTSGTRSTGVTAASNVAPAAESDAFIGSVRAVMADSSETAEPQAIESVVVTTPDDTEAAPVS